MHDSLPASGAVLTLTQGLQLAGLAPCIFIVIFLLGLVRRNRETIVPAFYFAALGCGFALPLLDIYPPLAHNLWIKGGMLFGESTLTAFTFLLICQFVMGRVPPWSYWLVLAIPLIGGSQLIYASMLPPGDCGHDDMCLNVDNIKTLYNIFSSAFIFLLLIYYSSRAGAIHGEDVNRKHKYWLIVALILLHLLILTLDLARLSGHMKAEEALLIATVLRLTFIYVVITSLFRVFYPALVNEAITAAKAMYDPEADRPYAEQLKTMLEVNRVYREMRLNRAGLAKKLGIGEHHLSRVINRHFQKSFSELLNGYRIEEAKQRLRNETAQITVIGFEVGFNSIASFNRVFKEKVGVSPTEYRGQGSGISTPSLSVPPAAERSE